MHPVGRRLERLSPVRPWAVLATLGTLLATVAVLHYFREVQGIGIGVGPVVAAVMGVSVSAVVVYAGVRLRRSDMTPDEGWVVVVTGLGAGVFAGVAYALTLVVRVAEGRSLVEPLFPLLVIGTIGIVGGLVIGSEYVTTRRLTREARESRDAMEFTNSLLRHDVRNALQIIEGHATLLRDHDDERVRESGETISGQTESLDQVITEVESVVEVLTGDVDGGTADVSTILEDVVESVAADRPGVTVDVDVGSDFPVIGGDALYPVFSNLVTNAIEHASEDSVRVEVEARRVGDRAVIRVADDGPGIPEEERDRIFERGVSTDGGGYGLYVAETVVKRLGGDIRVEESDLGGAAFVVEVPLTEEPADDTNPFES